MDTTPTAASLRPAGALAAPTRSTWKRIVRMRVLYLFLLFPLANLVVFHYVPIWGILIAFKDYKISLGILGSPWNRFAHFARFVEDPYFIRTFANTLTISVLRLAFGFPAPIILALLLNEIRSSLYKRVVQSISYLPHFMSWVVLSGMIIELLSPTRGLVPYLLTLLGLPAPEILTSTTLFVPMLIVTGIWQSVGWGTVVYLAAITSIDPTLYEAAAIDGANRIQMAGRITIPSITPVITILFILSLGGILNAGFDQIFNLYNPLVYRVADIIDTYTYRIGLIERQYDFAAAVGLSKNVIGVALILGTNAVTRKFSDYGIW